MTTTSARIRFGFLALIAAGSLGLSACGSDDNPSPSSEVPTSEAPSTDVTGMPNPASVYCEEQGGTLEIVDEEGGQVGYCNLPDGTRIEEWEYYRANQ